MVDFKGTPTPSDNLAKYKQADTEAERAPRTMVRKKVSPNQCASLPTNECMGSNQDSVIAKYHSPVLKVSEIRMANQIPTQPHQALPQAIFANPS